MKKFFDTFFLLLLIGIIFGLVSCGLDKPVEPEAARDITADINPDLSKAQLPLVALERIIAVQNQHTPELLDIPGVVGTAAGLGSEGNSVILVLTKKEGIPGIPRALDGVPVAVRVTGEIRALQGADPTSRFPRPVPIGVSTGHPDITAGTIGCRVTDDTYVYALSNNHVYANENLATYGDNVLQPGPYDGGVNPDDAIGTLSDYEPIVFSTSAENRIDAAIARSSIENLGTATPSDGYGTPTLNIVDAAFRLKVKKYGRTTGLTEGRVEGTNATVDVTYDTGTARFVDQIIIFKPGKDAFSLGGDSGSLVVTNDGNNPVGLLFAGTSDGTYAIINPIDLVLQRFNVRIDSEDGSEPNDPPAADFYYSTSGLTVNFTDQSTDSDGSVLEWNWDFGDGNSSTVQNPIHTYSTAGTYTVTLIVTDDDDAASNPASQEVSVNEPTSEITVTSIDPNELPNADATHEVIITGTGFVVGSEVTFENGIGPAPRASNVVAVDAHTITATVTTKSGGPPRNRYWDVRVTNPDGASGVLPGGLKITP